MFKFGGSMKVQEAMYKGPGEFRVSHNCSIEISWLDGGLWSTYGPKVLWPRPTSVF